MTRTDTASRPRPADAPTARRAPAPDPALTARQHPSVLVPGLKRLLKGSWEQRRRFVLAVLGATGFALLQSATSAVTGRATEEVSVPSFQRGEALPAVRVPGLKRLLNGSWEQRRWFVLAVLGATGFALRQIATSAVIGRVTEEVIVPSFHRGEATPALLPGGGLAILAIAVARAVTV